MPLSYDSTVWPEWQDRREASAYLKKVYGIKLGPAALANLAVKGGGPPFYKDGGKVVTYTARTWMRGLPRASVG
jgi:hypothetical protein